MKRVKLKLKQRVVDLFLDSGAFSAWSRGQEIKVKDYIGFVKENLEHIWYYVNLDVIPGKFGRRDNSQGEVEKSAKMSYDNQQKMKEAGLSPIPVFHQGERLYWLERYLADGETYIGLSASKFLRLDEQRRWLDQCFAMLTDKDGRPYVKTHGFALTAFPHITAYPWFTVDSTTWSLTPGYGQIIIPAYGDDGKPDYLATPTRIAISGVAHQSVSSQKKQFEAMGPVSQEHVRRFLREVAGISVTEARYGTQHRRRAMLAYYLALEKVLFDVRYKGPRAKVSGPDHLDMSKLKLKAQEPWNLHLAYATCLNREWSMLMNEMGARYRLLSYWELRSRTPELIAEYVQTGNHGEYKPAKMKPDWSETYLNKRRLALFARLEGLKDEEGEDSLAQIGATEA